MSGDWTEDDRESVRGQLVELVAGLPGVTVLDDWGHTGFLLGRHRFAWLRVDHHGDGRLALCVKVPPGEQEALLGMDPTRYFVPAYLPDWVGVDLFRVEPDWEEVAALLEQGWRLRAGKRAVAAFDASRQDGSE